MGEKTQIKKENYSAIPSKNVKFIISLEIKQTHSKLCVLHLLRKNNTMFNNQIRKWSLFICPTNPLEDMNTKDSKNRVVFMNSPSYKIRNSQNEFTKATYILETVPLKEKYLCGFL